MLHGVISSAYDLNGDGSVVVGLAWINNGKAHAFRWDPVNGMADLVSMQADSSRANAISADGSVS